MKANIERRLGHMFLRLAEFAARESLRRDKKALKYCGENVTIRMGCTFIRPDRVRIGDDTSIGERCYFRAGGEISIGRRCQIANSVIVVTTNHRIEAGHEYAGNTEDFDVKIGNNVWIASGSIILPDVRIGDNSVVAAGAVVTKDVPANVVVAGVPARVIRDINGS